MVKKYLSIIIVMLIPAAALAQQEDPMHKLLTQKRTQDCPEFVYNAELLIPRLHEENKLDSIEIILDYIEARCGSVHFAEYKLLRSIESLEFTGDWCDIGIIRLMIDRSWSWDWEVFPDYRLSHFYNATPYRTFVRGYAATLVEMTDSTSVAHLICRFYLGDGEYVIDRLRRGDFPGTCLQDEYDSRIAEIKQELKSFRSHLAAGLGIWIPLDNAETLGNKLEISAEAGFRFGRIGFDLTGIVRVFKSREFYELYFNERLVPTDHFVGGYLGTSFVTELFRVRKYNLEVFAGGGYDGFEALKGDDRKSVNSYNINFGFTARYFFNKHRNQFFGLQGRYNIVDYDTDGGTSLSGNTISLNVVYGYLGNPSVSREAERLRYFD